MSHLLHITSAKHLGGYDIRCDFSDGRSADIDLRPLLDMGQAVEQLRDPAVFASFRVDFTLQWPGDIDIAPEYPYWLAFRNDPEMAGELATWGYSERA